MKMKRPTATTLITNYLRASSDFANYEMLRRATGLHINQVTAACFHLRAHRVLDCVVEPDGVAWWFALPPDHDDRLWVCDQIKDGITKPGRRKRVVKQTKEN